MSEFYSYTPKAVILEPFSTLTNLSFWAAGVGLYILPFLSYERLPPQAFGAGMLLVLLGGCSGAFHADGSRAGTWRHATDRIMMYALAVYIAVISIGGLIQALRGQPADPRSTLSLVLNLLAPFSVVIVVLYQESIETSVLYISAYGPVTIICGVIAATLKPPELGVRLFAFARNLVVQLGVISVSFYINLYRGRYYLTQVLDHSVPGTEFKEDVGMGLVEPLPSIDVPRETFETAETLGDTDARMRELRRLHDVAHGRSHLRAISARSRATGRCGVSAAHPGMMRPRRYLGHISQRAHPQCDRGLGDGDDGGGGAERPAATAALDAGDGGAAAHVRRGGPPLRLRSH